MHEKDAHTDWVADAVAALRPMVDVYGAADFLHCSRRTIYRLIDEGLLAAVRSRKNYLIPRTAIDAYLRRLVRAA